MHKGPLSRDSLVDLRIGCFPFGVPPLGGSSFKEERPPEGGTPNPPVRRSVGQAVPSCLGRVPYGIRAFNVISLVLSVLSLLCVLSLEARFQWIRYEVLHVGAAQLEELGRHIVV